MVPKGYLMGWRERDQLNVHCWKRSSALHWSIIMLPPLSRKHWPLLGFFRRFPWKGRSTEGEAPIDPPQTWNDQRLRWWRMAPCWFSPQQKSTPVPVPRRCRVPAAGTLRFSPPPCAVWHGDNTPFRCCDESHWKMSIQSTAGGKFTVRTPNGCLRPLPTSPSSESSLTCASLPGCHPCCDTGTWSQVCRLCCSPQHPGRFESPGF